ncbi:MAG: thiamine phosphate synthase [Planctomycetia bacterium]|nr:thiamine phosphate synthase [Planctomycetia bacterium]
MRVLDAAANRAAEAVRVVEDYVRFVLDDAHLTACCKQLRHDLHAALADVPTIARSVRAACRQTADDVGTRISTSAEGHRDDLAAVAAANQSRLQQALRSLEEYAKLLPARDGSAPSPSAPFEALRYRSYTLSAAIDRTAEARRRLADVRLMALVDGRADQSDFEKLARDLFANGAGAIQLRDKTLDDRQLLARAKALAAIARDCGGLSIINDRADIAGAARADGVHLGQDDLPPKEARSIVGPAALIGISTHSIEQARQAVLAGATYLGVGPTFPSSTKSFAEFPGPALLRQVAAEITLPAFAIGGIDAATVADVLECGMRRIAVGQAITAAADPSAAARVIAKALAAPAVSPIPN